MIQKNEDNLILPDNRLPEPIPVKKRGRPMLKGNVGVINESTNIDEILNLESVQEQHLEKMARGYLMGANTIGKRKDVRDKLEMRVVQKIGRKGKYLVDKLFELIEGVYIVTSDKKDAMRYYKQPPNLAAIMYALDRALGKPGSAEKDNPESQGTTTIEQIIKKFADGTTEQTVKKTMEIKS